MTKVFSAVEIDQLKKSCFDAEGYPIPEGTEVQIPISLFRRMISGLEPQVIEDEQPTAFLSV